ncbi:LOW QUALITY PROTEIN: protein borderless [Galleria mellonella]|uniref:LOW QUALITY PROTEIN: protein borderless n=1 Tax=Galleria mellonella TaxID=7137 RepID=A0ABM3MTP2_GALME|nr:LOW QUALITY PROTEIN: protein borderless [Galleria mellonella]
MQRLWSVCVAVLLGAFGAIRVGGSLLPLEVERLSASVGGFAVMNCHLDFPFGNEIPYHLQWDKDGEIIFSWYSGEGSAHLADRWGGRVERLGDGRLGLGRGSINVSAVRETDAGLYRCRVTFPNRTPPERNNGTFYFLEVEGGNLIVTPPMNVTVLEGDRAEFECLPKDPESIVEWYKDGTHISEIPELALRSEMPGNGSIIIRQAVSTDPGEYQCRVRAPDSQLQTASAYLDVQYKAKVVYAPQERYLPFGKPASLDCHFSANPPLTNLRWEKDGFLFDPYNVPGVFYSRNGSLLFNQVDESHEGQYSCTPYNALGSEGPSPSVRVRVQRPPALSARPQPLYVARLGDAVTMPCAIDPQPDHLAPTLHWTRKDGGELPEGRHSLADGNLTISSVSEEDRGVYICTISNEAAAVAVEAELLVENVPPRAPYNLTARPSHHSIHLSWVPGHNGLEVDYTVWYRERAVSEWRTMKILSRGVTDATLVGLRPAAEYELRVLSQDHIGDGLFSKPIYVWTLAPEILEQEATAYAAAVTEGPPVVAAGGLDELEVSVRLIDDGALIRWSRDSSDESRCTVRWYEGSAPGTRLLVTAHTHHDYMLINGVEEGARYWARVECASGASGGAALRVPEYTRLRGVAGGCAAAALLLAAGAAALYFARHRLWPRHTTRGRAPPLTDKRVR